MKFAGFLHRGNAMSLADWLQLSGGLLIHEGRFFRGAPPAAILGLHNLLGRRLLFLDIRIRIDLILVIA
jgi:hypothetical protein